ncbi:MAG: agmatine deiminase family protein [Burkholderiaceae bacterium]|nr:agmatine deiminase family protein [Microbacteriaceae bacterium]
MTWRMPSETAPQERVWMAFPPPRTDADDTPGEVHLAHLAWSAVANAIVRFEPVTMLIDPASLEVASELLSPAVDVVPSPLDDAWMRDIGPTFVLDDDGRLGAVDWVFNGWGQQDWAAWGLDCAVGRTVGALAGADTVSSPIVNEGGGIHVDGLGTVLVTETVQLDPLRNPGLTRADIDAELARTIGATHVLWLPRGLTRDAQRFGTRGHVDIVATIPSPGVLLVHSQRDPAHPDFEICLDIIAGLATTTDAAGTPWRIIEMPAPRTVRDAEGWVDYSYLNHLVINGAVIACAFDDEADVGASAILTEAYPGREIVMIDARPIFARGGGIHCITQQQPQALLLN